ncbi:MAG: MBL fold metallo-hydrolase [Bryobacterales bacterium]|nr:MBL fold metallo-hydrolase [Bryobacteraceae bacterium]MDW8355044.1 MBL fold metallo-hydrolase [Bryobacterales bacterium]
MIRSARQGRCATTELREAPIVRLCVLASGSSGNCIFLATESTRVLVDAGLSRREIIARLRRIGESPERLDAILISHEHTDHVSGLPALVRGLQTPVYLSRLTAPAIDWGEAEPTVIPFQAGSRFAVGDIEVTSFTLPHDAADPVGFTFSACGVKVGLVTDLGYIPESVKYHLRGTDLLVLESNHDLEMLKVGPYPWSVKQRVMGRKGHLSNDLVCEFLRQDLDRTVSLLVLAHLSENNNHPELVRIGALQALQHRGLNPKLVIAEPRCQTEVFTF